MTEEEVIRQLANVSGVTYSEEQLKILHHHGGMCIVACAGSGKTTVIVDLIAKRRITGELPNFDKLLCTTYSKAGSLEMEERLNKKLALLGIPEKVKVKTLHASYYMVLRHFGMNFNICSNGQRTMFISQACKDAKAQLGDDDLQLIDSLLSFQVNNLMDDITLTKSYVYTLETVTPEQYSKIRNGYNQRKQEAGVIDFDDMQLYMYMLLVQQNRQDILNFCHSKWEYFFVDEFQDVSKIQFAILRKLVTDSNKLVCIGDDDQCIYQWRGADPSIILNICGYYDIVKFVLSTNYRCAGNIVNRAAVGIKNNTRRYDKDMIPFNQGGEIKVYDTKSCNLYKASLPAYAYIKHMVEEEHVNPQDIAVLARNNNHLSILSNLLFKDGIFTSTSPDMRISSMPLYKDAKNLIAFAENTYNKNLVDSILWRVCGYLGIRNSKVFSKLMDNTGCSIKDAIGYCLSHFAPGQRIEWHGKLNMTAKAENKVRYEYSVISVNAEYNLAQIYKTFDIEDMVERICALLSLYAVSMSFMYKSGDRARTLSGLVEYIQKLLKTDGIQATQSFMRLTEQFDSGSMVVTEPMITMSTMHGAKGREWKYVILFADDNLTFPSFEGISKMLEDGIAPIDIAGSIDENRRLHYVAMTRAKSRLTIFADVENISIYTLEAFGLVSSENTEYNNHIVEMAMHGIPSELLGKSIELFTGENSEYKFTEQLSIPEVIQDTGAFVSSERRTEDLEDDDMDDEDGDSDFSDPYGDGGY